MRVILFKRTQYDDYKRFTNIYGNYKQMKSYILSIIKPVVLVIIALQFNLLTAEDYDAIYKEIKHEYILNEDGSNTYSYSHKLQLFSSYAVNRAYGETFIVYDPDWQILEIRKSVTTMADGQIVSSPFNAYNEVLPRFASGAAPYLNLREMVVTHTGLEKNCTIDLDYTIETKKGFLPGMTDKIIIGGRNPIEKLDIIIKIPTGKKLSLNLANTYSKLTKAKEGKFDVYSWTFIDLPLIAVETTQPAFEDFLPVLYFSTATKNEVKDHLLKDKKLFDLNDKTSEVIDNLISGKFSLLEKSMALKNYVSNNVGTMNGALKYIGYNPIIAQEVFDRNVGSKLDKAILLSAMCHKAGIKAYPAIASKNSTASDDIAVVSQYENPFVLIFGEDNPIPIAMLDPNGKQSSQHPSNFLGVTIIPLVEDFDNVVRLYPKKDNDAATFNCLLTLNKGLELKGKASINLKGNYLPSLLNSNCNNKIKEALENQNYEVEFKDPDFISEASGYYSKNLTISSKELLKETGGLIKLDIPFCPLGIESKHITISPVERTTPYKLPLRINESEKFNIIIPEDKKFTFVPDNVILKNDIGELEILYNSNGTKLEISRNFIVFKEIINPKEYEKFYKLLSARFDPKHQSIYIE